jgi:hypothetical protein
MLLHLLWSIVPSGKMRREHGSIERQSEHANRSSKNVNLSFGSLLINRFKSSDQFCVCLQIAFRIWNGSKNYRQTNRMNLSESNKYWKDQKPYLTQFALQILHRMKHVSFGWKNSLGHFFSDSINNLTRDNVWKCAAEQCPIYVTNDFNFFFLITMKP